MPNQTCRLLSNGYKIDWVNNTLRLRPCCFYPESVEIKGNNIQELNDYRERISKIDSYTNPGCNQCNFQEKQNLRKTWRQASFDIVPEDAQPGEAYYLEIQIDTVCNGGCIICGPWHSSYWHSEQVKHNIPIEPLKHTNSVDTILNLIDIQKPRKILFLGGEPFLSDVDQKILPLINHPELVDLQYTTNGSIYPSEDRVDHWKRFKSVMINFSIDGIGRRFEYIRYPLRWATVQHNMFTMRDQLPENVHFKINHTINILNLYYWNEFIQWQQENFSHDRFNRPVNVNFSPAAGQLQPHGVTDRLWTKMLEQYSVDSRPCQTVKTSSANLTSTVDYLTLLDSRRNLDWRQVFPEIADSL